MNGSDRMDSWEQRNNLDIHASRLGNISNKNQIANLEMEIAKATDPEVRKRLEYLLNNKLDEINSKRRQGTIFIVITIIMFILVVLYFLFYINKFTPNDNYQSQTVVQEKVDNVQVHVAENENIVQEKTALSKFTDEQIEYARVWLAAKDGYIPRNDQTIEVKSFGPNDTIFPESNITWDRSVIGLHVGESINNTVLYSSNHDGTVMLYEIPTLIEDINEYAIAVKNSAYLISVPTFDDNLVSDVIRKVNV